MPKRDRVRKLVQLSQEKIDRAKRILGTRTDSETIEMALDQVRRPRAVWERAFRAIAAGQDKPLLPNLSSDSAEWEWDPPGN